MYVMRQRFEAGFEVCVVTICAGTYNGSEAESNIFLMLCEPPLKG
jgi:hypothetical protein